MATLIERLEARVAVAPPLPWRRDTGCWPGYIVDARNENVATEVDAADAELITAGINALPALLAVAKAATDEHLGRPCRDMRCAVCIALVPLHEEVR